MAPPITAIPVPSDNYDPPHTTVAAITSLRCVVESFDAAMDSLLDSIDRQSARLDRLEARVSKCRELMEWAAQDGRPVTIELPISYDRAIAGLGDSPARDDGGGDGDGDGDGGADASAVAAAREASNAAVRRVLRRDGELDDGNARLSDLWLDRASAFDERNACRSALRAHSVPSLRRQVIGDELDYYRDALEGAGNGGGVKESASSAALASGSSLDSDDGGASVRTGISLSSRIAGAGGGGSAGVTASDRRRQRQANSLARRRRNHAGTGAAAEGPTSAAVSSSPSRQQAASGSQPYLCEILHDAYGAGESPPTGEAGTVFPAPRYAAELLVFNSRKPAYGPAPSMSTPVAAARGGGLTPLDAKSSRGGAKSSGGAGATGAPPGKAAGVGREASVDEAEETKEGGEGTATGGIPPSELGEGASLGQPDAATGAAVVPLPDAPLPSEELGDGAKDTATPHDGNSG